MIMPLPLFVPECDLWDPKKEEFITIKPTHLLMEHSLISISKWETKWKVPFIEGPNPKSREKTEDMWLDYFRCMVISPKDPDPMIFRALPASARNEILAYISDSATASSVKKQTEKASGPKEQITSELVYFWMIYYGIPSEYDRWHFNRLIMLIQICQVKTSSSATKGGRNGGFNKGGAQSIENARISAARRAAAAKRGKR